jgi:hypothetical protein
MMSILKELLGMVLNEATLQQLVKATLKPSGTIKSHVGELAAEAAKMLQANPDDEAFVIMRGSPQNDRLINAIQKSQGSEKHEHLRVVRMPGGARLLVVDGDEPFILTTQHMRDSLVESAS